MERFHDPVDQKGKRKKKKGKKAKTTKPGSAFLQSVAGFLFVILVLGGLLYHQVQGLTLIDPYYVNVARIVLVVGFWVDGIIQKGQSAILDEPRNTPRY